MTAQVNHLSWQYQTDKPTMVELSGVLDRETVPSLWQAILKWQPNEEQLTCSLQHVERIDSAGMVLLIHLLKHAKTQNCHIMLSFVPPQLNMLLQLSNVEAVVAEHIQE